MVLISFILLLFSHSALGEFLWHRILDDQPKYIRVALARSSNYQQCVEGTKQKLKGWVNLSQKLAGMCLQNFNASMGSLCCLPFWNYSHCTKLVGAEVVLQNDNQWIKICVKFLAPCTAKHFVSKHWRWSTRKFMDCDGLPLCMNRKEIPSSFLKCFIVPQIV